MKQLAKLRTAGVMLISALLFAFALSYLANAAGLAAIVGAFAAGLIVEEVHFHGFREEITMEKLIKPIATFLVPIFFVLMGIQVRLETFANGDRDHADHPAGFEAHAGAKRETACIRS